MQFDKSISVVIGAGLHSHECLCGGEFPHQSTSIDGQYDMIVLLMRAAQTAIVCKARCRCLCSEVSLSQRHGNQLGGGEVRRRGGREREREGEILCTVLHVKYIIIIYIV